MENIKTNRNNYDVKVNKDGIMTITIDTNVQGEASKSGKTEVVSTTGGFVNVGGGLLVSFNICKK